MTRFPLIVAAAAVMSALGAGIAYADCQSDFNTLRGEMEEKGKALQTANKKKLPPQDVCPLFKAYTAAEGKLAKWLGDNKEWCQIPANIADQAIANNKKTAQIRDKVCQMAANGGGGGGGAPAGPPPQGSLSSALGVTTGYQLSPGGSSGVFETLNGNALGK